MSISRPAEEELFMAVGKQNAHGLSGVCAESLAQYRCSHSWGNDQSWCPTTSLSSYTRHVGCLEGRHMGQ